MQSLSVRSPSIHRRAPFLELGFDRARPSTKSVPRSFKDPLPGSRFTRPGNFHHKTFDASFRTRAFLEGITRLVGGDPGEKTRKQYQVSLICVNFRELCRQEWIPSTRWKPKCKT